MAKRKSRRKSSRRAAPRSTPSGRSKKLDAKALALSGGILWGLAILVWTWVAMSHGWGTEVLQLLSTVYIGFEMTPVGSVIGALWGFVDAAIGLWLFAKLYNWLL